MFFLQVVLAKQGVLGKVWLAAHWPKKLTKAQVNDTDISQTIEHILNPKVRLALRLKGHLLLGVVRIYQKKVHYLYTDCSDALVKLRRKNRTEMAKIDLDQTQANINAITLPEHFPEYDISLPTDMDIADVPAMEDGLIDAADNLNLFPQRDLPGSQQLPEATSDEFEDRVKELDLAIDIFGGEDFEPELLDGDNGLAPMEIERDISEGHLSEATRSPSVLLPPQSDRKKPRTTKSMVRVDKKTQLSTTTMQSWIANPDRLVRQVGYVPDTPEDMEVRQMELDGPEALLSMPAFRNLNPALTNVSRRNMTLKAPAYLLGRGTETTPDAPIDEYNMEPFPQELEEPEPMSPGGAGYPDPDVILQDDDHEAFSYSKSGTSSSESRPEAVFNARDFAVGITLRKEFQSQGVDRLNFDDMVETIHDAGRLSKRSIAAQLFSTVLALKSKERIDLMQKGGPYSDIMLVKRGQGLEKLRR